VTSLKSADPVRCAWARGELLVRYHDEEWGVPVHDDRTLFEFLILEGAQAGLSWSTILNKRENYRKAFDGFDPKRIARYDRRKVGRLRRPLPTLRPFFACGKNLAASTTTSGNSYAASRE
jgi:DNA-3-methyladenine glycosylase I